MNDENLKPFKKGEDERRNINGRPKKLPQIDKLLADVLGSEDDEESPAKDILKALLAEAKAGNVRAGEILLDRAYGKAQQSIDHTTKGESINPTPIKFSKGGQ